MPSLLVSLVRRHAEQCAGARAAGAGPSLHGRTDFHRHLEAEGIEGENCWRGGLV